MFCQQLGREASTPIRKVTVVLQVGTVVKSRLEPFPQIAKVDVVTFAEGGQDCLYSRSSRSNSLV